MSKIKPELQQTLTEGMTETFDLIVRTESDATPHLRWLASEGIEVKRQFRLTPGLAVSCTGQDALRLLEAEWVVSVELDAPVRAL